MFIPPASWIPASPIQTAYAIGADPGQPLGGVPCAAYLELGGAVVDPDALALAVTSLHRHPTLRAVMPDPTRLEDAGVAPVPLRVNDLRETPDPAASLEAIRDRLLAFGVDLALGRTWVIEASLLPDGTTGVHLAVSLVVTDLAGIGAMFADLARAVADPACVGPRIEVPALLHDLARAKRRRRVGGVPDEPRTPLLPPPDLPGDRAAAGPGVDRLQTLLGDAEWRGLGQRARALRVPAVALVLAVFTETLRRWSTRDSFIVTVTGVDARGSEHQVADRTRTYAVRALPAADLATLARQTAAELRHRLAQGVDAVEELRAALAGGTGHCGLSPYVFTYSTAGPVISAETAAVLGDLRAVRSTTPQVVIDCQVIRFDDAGVQVSFDVRRGVLTDGVAEAVFDNFVRALRMLADDAVEEPALDRVVTLPEETVRARARVNSIPPAHTDGLLHRPFRDRVAATPDAPAVLWDSECGPGRLSYAELDVAARRVAAALGGPGPVVAIRLPKGPEQVIAVLGVLYAGSAYLPLGIDQPDERVARICASAEVAVTIDRAWLDRHADAQPIAEPRPVAPTALAYVIYTSGSTGSPKGVAIQHAAVANTIADVNARNEVTAGDRTLAVSALDFDLSVYDLFGPLSVGGGVVCIDEGARRDAFRWAELVAAFGVTVWNTVPSLTEMLCAAAERPLGLRAVFCSGDWIDTGLPARLAVAAPEAVLIAMGGATEAAIWSNEFRVDRPDALDPAWPSIPYGLPLAGQRYRVADAAGRDRPDHVPGELWIGGAGVAAGYHGDEARTAERFVESAGERWYRTGDLGLWLPGPLLLFLGRRDTQVKIRGHRIECGEVEHALRGVAGIDQAVVVPIRQRSALGAVVTGAAPTSDAVRRILADRLPPAMVPAVIAGVPSLRLTANGKVDRDWAARVAEQTRESPGIATGDIARAWARAFGVDAVAPDAHFFTAGGDSLRATALCADLRAQGYAVTAAQLFAAPTLAEFETVCRTRQGRHQDSPGTPGPAVGPFPLTPLQRAYALGADGIRGVHRADPLFATVLAHADGTPVDIDRLTAALTALTAEFAILRCHRHGDWEQDVAEQAVPRVRSVATGALRVCLAEPGLDLGRAPAIEILSTTDRSEVGLRVSYLGLDARSLSAILHCLVDAYAGRPRRLRVDPELAAFAAYAAAGARTDRADDTAEPPPAPMLGATGATEDWSRPDTALLRLPPARVAALTEQARAAGVTLNAVLLHAFGGAVGELTGQDRIGISVPVSARPPAEPEVLGNFTELALCACGPASSVAEVHQQLGRVGDVAVAAGHPRHRVVFTSTLGLPELPAGGLISVWSVTSTPGVLIDCQVEPRGAEIEIRLDHPRGAHPPGTIARLLARTAALLGEPKPGSRPADTRAESVHPRALLARAVALAAGRPVRRGLEPVAQAWRAGGADGPVCEEYAQLLADCLTGERRVTALVDHPVLAPQALLIDSPGFAAVLESLLTILMRAVGPRVVELGSGTGLFRDVVHDSLRRRDPAAAARLVWHCVETDPLLAERAADRGLVVGGVPAEPVDLVVACGSLHRDPRLLAALAAVRPAPRAECWIAEPTEVTAAALVSAALLDPRILDPERTPVRDLPHWWGILAGHGWRPVGAETPAPGVVVLQARPAGVEPALERPAPATAGIGDLVAAAWQRHLGVRPGPDADFFVAGGDSLIATRLVAELQGAGLELRLADVFNHSRFTDLVDRVRRQTTPEEAGPAPEGRHALTEVQRAYLAGRDAGQLLGGVAAHCYFEFSCPDFDAARFEAAVADVVARHPALRTLVDGDTAHVLAAAPHPVVVRHGDPRAATEAEVTDPAARTPLIVRWRPDAGGAATIGIGMDNHLLDGASMLTALAEIRARYAGAAALGEPGPAYTFGEHVRTHPWVSGELPAGAEGERVVADRAYWDGRAEDLPPAPPLVDLARLAEVTRPRFERAGADLDTETWQRVRRVAAESGVTPAALLLAAYAEELADWAGVSGLTVTVTRFDRDPGIAGVDQVLGDFTSLVPVAHRSDSAGLIAAARRVQGELVEAATHATAGALWVRRRLVRRTGDPLGALFPVVFTCGLGLGDGVARLDDFGFGPLTYARSQTPQTLLDLQVYADVTGLHLSADHVVDLLEAAEVRRRVESIAARLTALLEHRSPVGAAVEPSLRERIRETWRSVLGELPDDPRVNFFRAGGDSLRATQCTRLLRDRVHPDVDLRMLLVNPDLDRFVAAVAALEGTGESAPMVFEEGAL